MALNNVSLVYSYFADPEKSQAISEGDTYVGNPDTDPEIGGNQKQVYHRQENGTDVPVSQPLQTGAGGVILINGSPAQIVVDGNYSIKVLDKSGAQKYYDPDRYDGVPITEEDFLTTGIIRVTTIQDLRDLDVTNVAENSTVYVLRYEASENGGGKFFTWNSTSTDADDGGMTILPTGRTDPGRWKRSLLENIDLRDFGILADDSTDNATQLKSLENYLRDQGGGIIMSDLTGVIRSSQPFICPPNVTWKVQAQLLNTSTTTQHDFGVLFGQCNREDIGRSKGVEETAHDAGTLTAGAKELTVGGRWNNTAGDFSNPATWAPQVGDLCVVCTTDDISGDPTRPVPSYTTHRKVRKVDGLVITLDKEIIGDGDYMVIPTSRNLGYDRTTYGGVGRMETIENVVWDGSIQSTQGYPFLTGGIINSDIRGEFNGRGVVYCNGLRSTTINATGYFTRGAYEVAIGSEDFTIESITAVYLNAGDTLTTACCKIGERAWCGQVKTARISADGWNGDDLFSVFAEKQSVIDQEIFGSATLRCAVIGASTSPATFFKSQRCRIESNGAMTGRLLESTNSEDLEIDISVTGETSNADAVFLRDSGNVKCLHVGTDTGVVRIEGEYLIGCIKASGTLVATGSRVQRDVIKPKKLSGYVESETFAASFTPTQDFKVVLTGNMTLNDPSGTFETGDTISMIFQQDGTGGRTLTYAGGSLYRGFNIPGGGTSNDRLTITFKYEGAVWACNATNYTWA